jgi:pimeloyl-ACP methyl ester carboxylesterase
VHLPLWATLALGLALFLLLFFAHALFWGWVYRVRPVQDELRFARTADGWRIALARRKPRGAARTPPVLLCHGLAANRGNLDFGIERYSLSLYLAQAGFDCFAVDLRGHGGSVREARSAPRIWNYDTYLAQDIPAALDEVRAATGHEQVLWVGHSQGALLGLCAAALHPERIAGVVAMAPPTHWHAQQELKRLLRFAFLAHGPNRWLARASAPLAGRVHPGLAQFALNTRNVEPKVLRQLMANVVEDVQGGVQAQFLRWASRDSFDSADGAVDYRASFTQAQRPALFVAGARDLLAPPGAVRSGCDLWGGPKELWVAGTAIQLAADYGHSDLVFGRHAPDEIFPRVRDWLLAQSR